MSFSPSSLPPTWRSLGELQNPEAFSKELSDEFAPGVSQIDSRVERQMSRRDFVKLMGASSALAGLGTASCHRPQSYIVPHLQGQEWDIPGKFVYYATSMPHPRGALPLLVTCHGNRPTKIEPNNLYKEGYGTSSFAQASILELYNPERSRHYLHKGVSCKKDDALQALGSVLDSGKTLGVLVGKEAMPTGNRLLSALANKYPQLKVYAYEALETQGREAAYKAAFDPGVFPVFHYEKAKRFLSLDSDFLELDSQGDVGGFYANRRVEGDDYTQKPRSKDLNRLYIAEASYSPTGGMADHRLPIAPSQLKALAVEIATHLGVLVQIKGKSSLNAWQRSWAKACAEDLLAHRHEALVIAGSRHDEELHTLCIAMNQALGAYEGIVDFVRFDQKPLMGSMEELKADLLSKTLDGLLNLSYGNPFYDVDGFEKSLGDTVFFSWGLYENASAKRATWHFPAAHYLESWGDGISAEGHYLPIQPMILPLYGGVGNLELLAFLQEGILFDSAYAENTPSPVLLEVKKTFSALADETQKSWKKLLSDGFYKKGFSRELLTANIDFPLTVSLLSPPTAERLELVFSTDASVYDGRYINNAWLQEAPDPITKVCWDNVALMSPQTAKDLKLYDKIISIEPEERIYGLWKGKNAGVGPDGEGASHANPLVELSVGNRRLQVAIMVGFGMADHVISLSLGYGQGYNSHDPLQRSTEHGGEVSPVGVNTGFNAYVLREEKTPYFARNARIKPLKGRYPMALTQEHHAMYGRSLAREISTLPTDQKHSKDFEEQLQGVKKQGMDAHAPENISLYKPAGSATWHDKASANKHLFDERQQWAMTVDLNVCTGCNTCLIACQAENNIPVVGKAQVARGREMHWIRLDRYFAAVPQTDAEGNFIKSSKGDLLYDESRPEMIVQPVSCVQCESAPCETVCPVNATVHTEDGLNAMAYNRCVGTRYCANNCPYKARRFNFFDYNKRNPLLEKNLYKGPLGETAVGTSASLQRNPNVTVRMRGVMEKCTYCVQRLQMAKSAMKMRLKQEALLAGVSTSEQTISDAHMRPSGVRVACQDACPSNAITFGNLLNGKGEKVVAAINSPRNYSLLHYLGTRPRTTYLARVKNPNKQMPDGRAIGRVTIAMH